MANITFLVLVHLLFNFLIACHLDLELTLNDLD